MTDGGFILLKRNETTTNFNAGKDTQKQNNRSAGKLNKMPQSVGRITFRSTGQ